MINFKNSRFWGRGICGRGEVGGKTGKEREGELQLGYNIQQENKLKKRRKCQCATWKYF